MYRDYTKFYFITIIIMYTCATFLALFSGGGFNKVLRKIYKPKKGETSEISTACNKQDAEEKKPNTTHQFYNECV